MIPNTMAPQWWSATGTWRLLRCPASATPARAPVRPPGQAADNVGSVAHLALQAWAESGEWSLPDPGTRLQERFDEVAAAHEVDPVRMPQGVVTRARLKTRARQLAAILSGASADVRSELLLSDESNHLFGILDIAGTGPNGFIIDFKTGRDASTESSSAIEHQMTFYAHLFETIYGTFPEHVIVFSLQRGPAEIQVTPSAVAALLEQIRAAQLTERAVTRPDAYTCRFCPKRMTCQPHWDAVPGWERPDAIEGTIGNIEHSSSGTAALLIGGRWLTGIPENAFPGGTALGKFARAVRVRRCNDSEPEEWSADRTTHIQITPAR
jgi:hypothetical protein